MDPRLQAGVELQLEKQAQQEHDSSLSGVLGQYFKQAENQFPVPPTTADPKHLMQITPEGRGLMQGKAQHGASYNRHLPGFGKQESTSPAAAPTYVPIADTISRRQPALAEQFGQSAQDRLKQMGGTYKTTMPRQDLASAAKPGVSSLHIPASSPADVEAARRDPRFATQSRKTVWDNFASRLRNLLK